MLSMRDLTKLDPKDKRLIAELDFNSRASLSELSKKLKLSREAVNYRIKRLTFSGFIRSFVTHIDLTKFDYDIYTVYLKFGIMNEKKEKEVIDYLRNIPTLNWSAVVGGRFDFILEFPAKNIREFQKRRVEIINKFPNTFVKHEVSIFTFQQRLNRRYLYPIKDRIRTSIESIEKLSKKDEQILAVLKYNSRLPVSEISKMTKIPNSTVAMRIKKLKQTGVIKDFSILFNPAKMEYHNYKSCISLSKHSDKIYNQIKTFCEENPHVVYYISCIGRWDYEIDFEVENHTVYRRCLRDFQNLMGDSLSDIETLEIFNSFRFNL